MDTDVVACYLTETVELYRAFGALCNNNDRFLTFSASCDDFFKENIFLAQMFVRETIELYKNSFFDVLSTKQQK